MVDFGRHSEDYGRYRPGFPTSFFDRLEALRPFSDTQALDLGTGPGVVALELARRGARVVGVDVAPNQLKVARRLAEREYLSGSYSIADMATWPWISRYEWHDIDWDEYPNLMRWYLAISSRDAVQRGYHVPHETGPIPIPD